MKARDTVRARGHPLVQGTHTTTFEVTKDETLTLAGDCIIGIAADKGAADLAPDLKALLSDDRAVLTTRLIADDQVVVVRRGDPQASPWITPETSSGGGATSSPTGPLPSAPTIPRPRSPGSSSMRSGAVRTWWSSSRSRYRREP